MEERRQNIGEPEIHFMTDDFPSRGTSNAPTSPPISVGMLRDKIFNGHNILEANVNVSVLLLS